MDQFREILGLESRDPYSERKVAKDSMPDGGVVSTVRVYDGLRPFETLVASPDYHEDCRTYRDATIVEAYDDADAARQGHDRWVARYLRGDLPDPLVHVPNARDPVGTSTLPETPRRRASPGFLTPAPGSVPAIVEAVRRCHPGVERVEIQEHPERADVTVLVTLHRWATGDPYRDEAWNAVTEAIDDQIAVGIAYTLRMR